MSCAYSGLVKCCGLAIIVTLNCTNFQTFDFTKIIIIKPNRFQTVLPKELCQLHSTVQWTSRNAGLTVMYRKSRAVFVVSRDQWGTFQHRLSATTGLHLCRTTLHVSDNSRLRYVKTISSEFVTVITAIISPICAIVVSLLLCQSGHLYLATCHMCLLAAVQRTSTKRAVSGLYQSPVLWAHLIPLGQPLRLILVQLPPAYRQRIWGVPGINRSIVLGLMKRYRLFQVTRVVVTDFLGSTTWELRGLVIGRQNEATTVETVWPMSNVCPRRFQWLFLPRQSQFQPKRPLAQLLWMSMLRRR